MQTHGINDGIFRGVEPAKIHRRLSARPLATARRSPLSLGSARGCELREVDSDGTRVVPLRADPFSVAAPAQRRTASDIERAPSVFAVATHAIVTNVGFDGIEHISVTGLCRHTGRIDRPRPPIGVAGHTFRFPFLMVFVNRAGRKDYGPA